MLCRHCRTPLERKRFNGRLEDAGAFKRRKFCGRGCMALWMEGQIKVPSTRNSRRQSHKRARAACQGCQRSRKVTRLYVHHRDENPMNNDPRNLMTLCGSCHRRSHSPNFMATGALRKPCKYCSALSVKLGMCETHLSRLRRYGHPLAKKRRVGSGWVLMLHDGSSWSPFPS